MENLKLTSLLVLSMKEKKSKKITFHEKVTIINGVNDTGKSALIKSIFYTFGANTKLQAKWKKANIVSCVTFKFQNNDYKMVRYKDQFGLFDNEDKLIQSFYSVTDELAPYFANLFNFKIELKDSNNRMLQVPPAFCLLPFYIDQDNGWQKTWSSFEQLGQLKYGWKKNIIDFHTGARPSEYYSLKKEKDELLSHKQHYSEEQKELDRLYLRTVKKFGTTDVSVDIDEFEKEIEILLNQLNNKQTDLEYAKENLVGLYNDRYMIEDQINLTNSVMDELNKDYTFATKNILEDKVTCPTCGEIYSNSFNERFSIANDESRCFELIADLKKDLQKINKKIDIQKKELNNIKEDFKEIHTLLQTKKKQVALNDVIQNEGKRMLLSSLATDIANVHSIILDLEEQIKTKDAELKNIDNKEKRKIIKTEYLDYMNEFLLELDVKTLSTEDFKNLDTTIKESGSDVPRALLAYFFSILKLIVARSTSTLFPIIIDSPLQQEPDDENKVRILEFIKKNTPQDAQLILSTVDSANVNFEGSTIQLNKKLHVLDDQDYEKHWKQLKLLLEQLSN